MNTQSYTWGPDPPSSTTTNRQSGSGRGRGRAQGQGPSNGLGAGRPGLVSRLGRDGEELGQRWEDGLTEEERRVKREEEYTYLNRIFSLMATDRFALRENAVLKLWEDGPNYQKVVKYVNNSQCHSHLKLTVLQIHRVYRRKDPETLEAINDRMLLWHGTKRNNIPKILEDGFQLPTTSGQMFGRGIYFADRITKSSNYSDSDVTFLLLCEVGVGKVYSCRTWHNDWTSAPAGFDSVKATGKNVPDWNDEGMYYGAHVPFGKTVPCTKYETHSVNYNEFIVYDPSRIIIRFLVEVKIDSVTSPSTTLANPLVLPLVPSLAPLAVQKRRVSGAMQPMTSAQQHGQGRASATTGTSGLTQVGLRNQKVVVTRSVLPTTTTTSQQPQQPRTRPNLTTVVTAAAIAADPGSSLRLPPPRQRRTSRYPVCPAPVPQTRATSATSTGITKGGLSRQIAFTYVSQTQVSMTSATYLYQYQQSQQQRTTQCSTSVYSTPQGSTVSLIAPATSTTWRGIIPRGPNSQTTTATAIPSSQVPITATAQSSPPQPPQRASQIYSAYSNPPASVRSNLCCTIL